MRSILTALLLLVTAVLMYTAIAGGDTGMVRLLERSGGAMSDSIRSLSP